MFRELKIFTELERRKNNEENKQSLEEQSAPRDIGLPHLLSYAMAKKYEVGEILMTNEGRNLKYWQEKIPDKSSRMLFAMSMIYQVTKGLQTIHGFMFAHSDLKLENICARLGSNNEYKFTLIDFGVVTRLPLIGESYNLNEKLFRGNLLTASLDHILSHRATTIDDMYSLLCVAYQFVFKKLPWHEKLDRKLSMINPQCLTKEFYQ